MVNPADQPAKGHAVHDVRDAVVGVIRRGRVVHGQEDAGRDLQDEEEQGGRTQGVPPVPFGLGPIEYVLVETVEIQPFVKPLVHAAPHG